MALETASFIHQLNPSYPAATERVRDGDDHIRSIKRTLLSTFPGIKGPLSEDLTHTFLNSLLTALTPVGMISLWSGSTIPDGWAICNGQLANRSDGKGTIQTPDLRGRVPVGVSPDHALLSTFGAESVTVSTTAVGDHTHSATAKPAGDHKHDVSGITIGSATTGVTVSATSSKVDAGGSASNVPRLPFTTNDPGHTHTASNGTTSASGEHTHEVTTGGAGGHSHQATVNVVQPSIAIHYLMKV